MNEIDCAEVRRRLHLAEKNGLSRHLAGCEACRTELPRIRAILRRVGDGAEIEPPITLDQIVREWIRTTWTVPTRTSLPVPVLFLAALWVVGLVTGMTLILSASRVESDAPVVALAIVGSFLAVCATASLPALMIRIPSPSNVTFEVRR